jgi:hypothetical protein
MYFCCLLSSVIIGIADLKLTKLQYPYVGMARFRLLRRVDNYLES